jgi:uncharacterized membrane protein
MADSYALIKTIHIISSTILFGTGVGTAFFMFCSRFAPDLHEKYFAARTAVLADWIFTTPAVIIQPLTGIMLIRLGGYAPMSLWLTSTYVLYILIGLLWLPVVWIQIKLRNMLAQSLKTGEAPPPLYEKMFRMWITFGAHAFIGVVAIFFLMVMKPV